MQYLRVKYFRWIKLNAVRFVLYLLRLVRNELTLLVSYNINGSDVHEDVNSVRNITLVKVYVESSLINNLFQLMNGFFDS